MPADCLLQYGRPAAHRGLTNGGTFILVGVGNDQFDDGAPDRFGFAVAEQTLRARVPGLDREIGSDAYDGITGSSNDGGELGAALHIHALSSHRSELPHGAAGDTH